MSTRDVITEYRIRAWLCIVALMLGAAVTAWVGFRVEFPPAYRATAVQYTEGYAAWAFNLCSGQPPFRKIPDVCNTFLGINRVAVDPAEPPHMRASASSFYWRIRRVALRWIPGGAVASAALLWWLLSWRNRRAWRCDPDPVDHIRLRGSEIVEPRRLTRLAKRKHGHGDLQLGGVTIPEAMEAKHTVFAGGTGQGKTAGIAGVLDVVHDRGDRAIVADSGGLFLSRYGFDARRGDIVLNPLDRRSVPWSPLAEIRMSYHADAVAHALVPDAEGPDATWHTQAQTFLSAVLQRVHEVRGTNRDLLRLALEAGMPELREKLAGTPAAGQVGDGNERMFNSVRSTVAAHLACLRYCPLDAGCEAFSIREWAAVGGGWAYFNYLDDQLRVMAPLAGAMLALAATGIMTRAPGSATPTWLILDEVAALGKIGVLEDFLTRARKSGGRAVVGLQSIAQLRERYGRNGAESMLSCLSTQLVLNVSDPDTADFMSRVLGDVQVAHRVRSAGHADHGANAQWSQTVQTERLILPSEISSLPELNGFLRIAGFPVARVRLPLPTQLPARDAPFLLRDIVPAAQGVIAGDPTATPEKGDLPDFGNNEDRRS
jgi:hypothetical protein